MALTELWRTPSPSSGFLDGVTLQVLPRRTCVLSFRHEGADAGWERCELWFHEVVAYKCTYMTALTVEMIESAYDRLMDMGSTSWLSEAAKGHAGQDATGSLKHLRICFDDGPCYEFVCSRFDAPRGQVERLLFSYQGRFQWWTYAVSQGQLLLRRPRSAEHADQVDVLFKDVGAVNLPTSIEGLKVHESDRRELPMGGSLEGGKLFVVRGQDVEGYVVAGAVFHDQGDHDFHDPSPLLLPLPVPSRG